MRRILSAVVLSALLVACGSSNGEDDGRISVVASFYPLAEIAQRVGDAFVDVENLTPAGVEPHDIELTASDVDRIAEADLVLFVGAGFQPGVAKIAGDDGVDLADVGDGDDPHFWLDPSLMVEATERVLDALIAADPGHASDYRANAEQFGRELRALDDRYKEALADCERRVIVTAHGAFGYLAKRYGLTQEAITGVAPESEASPARLVELERFVREHNVTTIFYEELVPRAFADTLAKEARVKAAVLNPLEGLTEDEQTAGEDYLSIMGRNRVALVEALGCR